MAKNKMFYSHYALKDADTGEIFGIEAPNASVFVERLLTMKDPNDDLVPTSVKLPARLVRCLENNSKVLGISKSELHREALEIGINEITSAYEDLISDADSTETVID